MVQRKQSLTVCNFASISIQVLNSLVSPEMASVLLPCVAARSVFLGGCGHSDLVQKPLCLEGDGAEPGLYILVAGLL